MDIKANDILDVEPKPNNYEVLKVNLDMMEKDRDRFYKLYHDLYDANREYKKVAEEKIQRLSDESNYLLTLCMRYEEENQELKKKLDNYL